MRRPIAILLAAAGVCLAAEDVVLRAMVDEMTRAMRELRLEDLPRPYYMDHMVLESDTFSGLAVFGGLARERRQRSRSQVIRVRVGDYRFDNTNFPGGGQRAYDVYTLPLEDDYGVLRRHFWLAADETYKAAVEALARKRAALRNINLAVQLNDFAKAEPVEILAEKPRLEIDAKVWSERLRQFSAVFRRYPKILSSRVEFEASAGTRYFVNSEGTRVRDPEVLYLLQAFATAQAADGMRLSDAVWIAARREALLGSPDAIRTQMEQMAERLSAFAAAGVLDSYSGPVLFEKMAAAQLFAELLGRNLAMTRNPVGGGRFGGQAGGIGGALDGRRKSRVLPEWMDVVDDATVAEWQGRPLLGHYQVDLEGVRPQRVEVVRRGVLENFLLSRLPVKGFEGSNGHARLPGPSGTSLAAPGNLFVTARQTVPEAELKKQLLEICRAQDREFGVIIRKLDFPSAASREDLQNMLSGQGQEQRPSSFPIAVYKVYVADGREEPVRGVRFAGLSVRTLKDIIAAGDQAYVFDYIDSGSPFAVMEGSYGAETSVIAPSFLVEDVELKGGEEQRPRLPVVPHPYFSQAR
jgi:predicted Zn-dependent protease